MSKYGHLANYDDKLLTQQYRYYDYYSPYAAGAYYAEPVKRYAISTFNGSKPVRTVAASSPVDAVQIYVAGLAYPQDYNGNYFFARNVSTNAVTRVQAKVTSNTKYTVKTSAA